MKFVEVGHFGAEGRSEWLLEGCFPTACGLWGGKLGWIEVWGRGVWNWVGVGSGSVKRTKSR